MKIATLLTLFAVAAIGTNVSPPSAWGTLYAQGAQAPSASTTPSVEVDQGWPRTVPSGESTITLYQPQVDRWEGNVINAYQAISVRKGSTGTPIYGVAYFTARAEVNKASRLVTLEDYIITNVSFPSDVELSANYKPILQTAVEGRIRTIALDRLEANLATTTRELAADQGKGIKNDPPNILFSTTPSVLLPIDGTPNLRPVLNYSNLQRVINTRALILFDSATNNYSLTVLGKWLTSDSISGPWKPLPEPPAAYSLVKDSLVLNKLVDVLNPNNGSQVAKLENDVLPNIYVSTSPTELLQTTGEPEYASIEGTKLQYVSNTGSDIFQDTDTHAFYVDITGRWFTAGSLEGPWSHVDGKSLPADFAKIPVNSKRANVLVSVPGTLQAKEALIANEIPQTAVISRNTANLNIEYDGDPQLRTIEGTGLRYVANSKIPVILADNGGYYAVDRGVWYQSVSLNGPWDASEAIPESIYTIPPSSPLYYVTFVRIYQATPTEIYCGYTPGYYGTAVSNEGTVVYGTGYDYSPFVGSSWIASPWTYGLGAGLGWTQGAGWGFDFGIGYGYPIVGTMTGPFSWTWQDWLDEHLWSRNHWWQSDYPWYQRGWDGYGRFNSYNYVGSTVYHPTISHYVVPPVAQRPIVTPPRASSDNVFATREGQVYRRQSTGTWQLRQGNTWRPTNSNSVPQLQRQQQGRAIGGRRYQNFNQGGGTPQAMPRSFEPARSGRVR